MTKPARPTVVKPAADTSIPAIETASLLEAMVASHVLDAIDLPSLFQLQHNLIGALSTSLAAEHAEAAVTALFARALARLPEHIGDALREAARDDCAFCEAAALPARPS